jgi:hypothetical protein
MVDYHTQKTNIIRDEVEGDIQKTNIIRDEVEGDIVVF